MAFKLRSNFTKFGLSNKFTSPLKKDPTDPTKEKDFTVTSDVTTGEDGNTVQVMERERVDIIDPTRNVENIETDNEKFLAGFSNEYKKAQESGFKGTLPEYIKKKEQGLGFTGSEEKIKQERVITDLNKPVENVEIIKKEVAKPFFDYPGRGEVDFKEKNWQRTPAGKQAVQYFGQMGKQLKNTLLQMSPYSKRKALNELNMYGDENMTKVMVDMHNNDPKKLEEIIRKYQPGNIGEGSMETIEERLVTQSQNSSKQDTGWQNIINE